MKNADANRLRECITYLTEDDPIAIAKERYDLLKSDETRRRIVQIKETVDFGKYCKSWKSSTPFMKNKNFYTWNLLKSFLF